MLQQPGNRFDKADHLYISEAGRSDRSVAIAGTMTIGRDDENDLVLQASTVSRQHALLFYDDVGLLLIDLQSTNGVFINSTLVQPDEAVRLVDGDRIRLGHVVLHYSADTRSTKG